MKQRHRRRWQQRCRLESLWGGYLRRLHGAVI
jgi:hypothetical protein